MSKTGNLASMMAYVDEFGGHLTVVFRSAKHPSGKTMLSGPLQKTLKALADSGRATIEWLP